MGKFAKLKLRLINRQLMEAASLHVRAGLVGQREGVERSWGLQASQQLSWEWEVERLGTGTATGTAAVAKASPLSVPTVQVVRDFDLVPPLDNPLISVQSAPVLNLVK